jgi:acetolactate synthase-1/2/3 large subunit
MAPVFTLAGKASINQYDRNELQDFNQLSMVEEMTKHARAVLEGHRIPEYIGRAAAIATTDQPGPVYIEIPRDKMDALYEMDEIDFQKSYVSKSKPGAGPAELAEAVEMIKAAERPMLIVGSGAFFAGAADVLKTFVEKTGIPVFTRNAARGIMPDTHPLVMGIGASQHPVCAAAVEHADLIIILGTRTGFTLNRAIFPKDANILRIDISSAAITDQLDVKLGLVGDAKVILEQLLPLVEETSYPDWLEPLVETDEGIKAFTAESKASDQFPIHPLRLCDEIAKVVDEDTVVVIDGGDAASWGNMVLPAMGPGQMLSIANGSFGPLGVGVPYAMAAKLAHPDKKVILLTGDGALGYGLMELDTAIRYGINFTTVVLNDSCWGMIKNSEAKKAAPGKEFVGLYLRDVKYDEVATALGGHGEFVTEAKDIAPAIKRALESDVASVVNVMTDVNIPFAF